MSNAPDTTLAKKEPTSVKDFLALPAYHKRFEEVMGKRAPQFMASITNAVTQSAQLAKCEPRSVIAAAFIAATLDLPIDKNLGFAFLIPYKDACTFQLGFKGLVQLALRSGSYARMNACPVNAEAFNGYDEVGEPVIDWSKLDETKPAVGYAASWKLTNGFTKVIYWTKEKVEAHAKRFSQAYRGQRDTPWKSDFDAMATKTVLKNGLSRWGILSIDMQRGVTHDQGAQKDIDADVEQVDNSSAIFDMGSSNATLSDALGEKQATPAGDKQTTLDLIDSLLLDKVHLSESQCLTMLEGRGHSVKNFKTIAELPLPILLDLKTALYEAAAKTK